MNTPPPMRVTQLRRHPVKSFQGEQIAQTAVDRDGIRGDATAWTDARCRSRTSAADRRHPAPATHELAIRQHHSRHPPTGDSTPDRSVDGYSCDALRAVDTEYAPNNVQPAVGSGLS